MAGSRFVRLRRSRRTLKGREFESWQISRRIGLIILGRRIPAILFDSPPPLLPRFLPTVPRPRPFSRSADQAVRKLSLSFSLALALSPLSSSLFLFFNPLPLPSFDLINHKAMVKIIRGCRERRGRGGRDKEEEGRD